jgi:predicted AAA+ superfamily ATPase
MQVVTGARQVGKTTLVTQIVERARLPCVFASADEPTLRGPAWIDAQWDAARLLLRDTDQSGALLVLDEVQKVPHWSEAVKRLGDADTRARRPLWMGDCAWSLDERHSCGRVRAPHHVGTVGHDRALVRSLDDLIVDG